MAGLLGRAGYRLAAQPEGADFVVINTCGFIAEARGESHAVIREMLALKRRGRLGGVIVAGCLAQRDQEKLLEMCPEIDQVVGVFAREEIVTAARRTLERRTFGGDCPNSRPTKMGLSPSAAPDGERMPRTTDDGPVGGGRMLLSPVPARPLPDTQRLRITPPHVAFLKIAEGCSRSCSFCAIPQFRGPYASKPIEEVVAEAAELVADGARELVVIAQDTSSYGLDLYGQPRLAELLWRLEQLEGPAWIRLMYLYPLHVSDELIEVIAGGKEDLALSGPAAAAHRRRDPQPYAAAGDAGRYRIAPGPAPGADRPAGAADHLPHRLSRRNRGAVRAAAGVRPAAAVRAPGGLRF